jgi:DNA repair protein RecN (Recombination protein N)
MLRKLTIQNYALIDSLDIDFPEGLIIITGETGAGKSILLGAISLLLGKKAEASVFNDPAKNCVVEAEFDDEMILRRVISPSGRSRSFLNDEPVTLAELTEISNRIIDIHGQHQHLLLSDADFQLSVLDQYSGAVSVLERYRSVYDQCKAKSDELSQLKKEMEALAADAEYREFQLRQLEEASLVDGELEELEQEQSKLANAENIKGNIQSVISLLNPYETSLAQNLKEASSLIGKVAAYIPSFEDLSQRLDSVRIEVEDIQQDVERTGEGIVVSPERLEQVEDRMSQLYSLMKKHHCDNIAELIKIKESLQSSFDGAQELQDRALALEKEIKALSEKRDQLAGKLSAARCEGAPKLSQRIEEAVRSLEMPKAIFRVEVTPVEKLTPKGGDALRFLFSANGDSRLSDISKVASGGELSRVMLALKSVMAQITVLPTMIFDEIDTGVSGKIADRMGTMIGQMGENMQIFSITHLPQIASKKGAHYLVYKEFVEGGAKTQIKQLSQQERVMELARMLSGADLTDAAIENAKELLKNNL